MEKNIAAIVKILNKRAKLIHNKRREEYLNLSALRHKSRRIRQASPLHSRIGWYTDRLQELQLVIKFLEGNISKEEFITHKVSDELGQMSTFIGNVCSGTD